MVTGASTADVALLLLDARRGITEQSRRHAFLATLLGVPHLVLCVNKMDLVDWSEDAFEAIREEFTEFASRLRVRDMTFIPVSALLGDNVVNRSTNMPWYDGLPLLRHLSGCTSHDRPGRRAVPGPVRHPAPVAHGHRLPRLPGTSRRASPPGDPVMVLPSGFETLFESIATADGAVDEAYPPMAVTITLTDHLDIGRGDMLCRPHNVPTIAQELDAQVCWMDESAPMQTGAKYAIKHTTRWARALVREIAYRIDVNTLHRHEGVESLALNEIGRCGCG
jgi:bifunctional enzyme CysN/CysC